MHYIHESMLSWMEYNHHITLEALMQGPWLWKSSSQVEFCSTTKEMADNKFIIHQCKCVKNSCKNLPAVPDEGLSRCSVFPFICFTNPLCLLLLHSIKKKLKENRKLLERKLRHQTRHAKRKSRGFLAEQLWVVWHMHFSICSGPNKILSWVVIYEINFFSNKNKKNKETLGTKLLAMISLTIKTKSASESVCGLEATKKIQTFITGILSHWYWKSHVSFLVSWKTWNVFYGEIWDIKNEFMRIGNLSKYRISRA